MKKEKKRQYSEFKKVTMKVYPSRILNLCGYGMKVIDYDMRWDDRLTKRGGGGRGYFGKTISFDIFEGAICEVFI